MYGQIAELLRSSDEVYTSYMSVILPLFYFLSPVQTQKKIGANREIIFFKKRPNFEDIASIFVSAPYFLRVSTVFPPYIEHDENTEKIRS